MGVVVGTAFEGNQQLSYPRNLEIQIFSKHFQIFFWGIITLTKVLENGKSGRQAGAITLAEDDLLKIVRTELATYFSEREGAGREGLLGWEVDYLCGRIALSALSPDERSRDGGRREEQVS